MLETFIQPPERGNKVDPLGYLQNSEEFRMRCSRVSQGWTGPVNVTSRVPRDADPETEVCLQDFYRGVLSDQHRGAMKGGAALGRCICNKVSRSARQGSSLRNQPLCGAPQERSKALGQAVS